MCVHTTVGRCSTVLLRVLGPASGVCYSTGPEFPELCTGAWPLAEAPYIFLMRAGFYTGFFARGGDQVHLIPFPFIFPHNILLNGKILGGGGGGGISRGPPFV